MSYQDYLSVIHKDANGNPSNFTTLPTIDGTSYAVGNINGTSFTYSYLTPQTVHDFTYRTFSNYYASSAYETNFSALAYSPELLTAIKTITKYSSGSQNFVQPYSVYFGDVAKVTFAEGTNGDIAIGLNTNPASGSIFSGSDAKGKGIAYDGGINTSIPENGDVWFNTDVFNNWQNIGAEGFAIVLHEFGHALGLSHPPLNSAIDSQKYTIMSTATDAELSGVYAHGLQLYDIAAIQSIYGRNYTNHGENGTAFGNGNGFSSGSSPFYYTIWDGGGTHDKIDVSDFNIGSQIDLRQGQFSSIGLAGGATSVAFDAHDSNGNTTSDRGNVAISFFTVIEDAVGGGGGDVIIGNAWANTLDGRGGNDVLFGDGRSYDANNGFVTEDNQRAYTPTTKYADDLSGNDVLVGGAGNDILKAGAGANQLAIGGIATLSNGVINGGTSDTNDGDDSYIIAMEPSGDHAEATVTPISNSTKITVSNIAADATKSETDTALFSIENIIAQRLNNLNTVDTGSLAIVVKDFGAGQSSAALNLFRNQLSSIYSGDHISQLQQPVLTGFNLTSDGKKIGNFYNFALPQTGDAGDSFYLRLPSGETGNRLANAGGGKDLISYIDAEAPNGMVIDLNADPASGTGFAYANGQEVAGPPQLLGDELIGFENVEGTNFNDRIVGNGLDNTINGAGGTDSLAGGIGNDTFIGSADGDFIDGEAGDDVLTYSHLNAPIDVTLGGDGNGTVTLKGATAGAHDTLASIKEVIGTTGQDSFKFTGGSNAVFDGLGGSDEFIVSGSGNLTVIGDEISPIVPNPFTPNNFLSFIVNEGHDTLDLSQIAQGLTVRMGGGALVNGNVLGYNPTLGTTTFSDGKTLNFSGVEEVTLGVANDRLIVGEVRNLSFAGVLDSPTKFNMGESEGDNDTVEVWGHSVLKDGVLYAHNGTQVTGFETIDLTTYYRFVSGDDTLRTTDLGYKYVQNGGGINWLDYRDVQQSLTFNLDANNHGSVTDGTEANTDNLQGSIALVGTGQGDTWNVNSQQHGYLQLGTGNDTVNINTYFGQGFIYTGGQDTFIGGNNISVTLREAQLSGGLSVDHADQGTLLKETSYSHTYGYDVTLTVNGVGSLVFKNWKEVETYRGQDGVYGTADDSVFTSTNYTTVFLDVRGAIYLGVEGNITLPPLLPPNTFLGGITGIAPVDVFATTSSNFSGAGVSVAGGMGNNMLSGGSLSDELGGGVGNDTLAGGAGGDLLHGDTGNDLVQGGDGNDVAYGGAGLDTIDGGTGINYLSGGSEKDVFVASAGGTNTIVDYSQEDQDVIRFSSGSQANLTSSRINNALQDPNDLLLSAGGASVTIAGFFENFFGNEVVIADSGGGEVALHFDENGQLLQNGTGTANSDVISGSGGNDTLASLEGNDRVYGFGGDDSIDAGDGDDFVSGGAGNDSLLAAAGNDIVFGDGGNDLIIAGSGAGNDTYDGGEGVDTLKYTSATQGITININATGGTASGADIDNDIFTNIEKIITSPGNDTITVAAGAAPVELVYVSGNDIYNVSSAADVEISFDGAISASQVSAGNTVNDGSGHITQADFLIAGHGSLTLQGDNLAGQIVKLQDGSAFVVTPAGIAAAQTGTAGDDSFTFSAAYHAYSGLGGNDTLNLAAVASDTAITLQSGVGIVSGAAIGTNYLESVEKVITGTGNDTVSVINAGAITYMGGNDVYTLTGSASSINIFLPPSLVGPEVTVGSFTASGGIVTQVVFNVAGFGTLTLQGANLVGFSAKLFSGDGFEITATGVEAPSVEFGTAGNDIINPPTGTTKVLALGGDDVIIAKAGITQYDGGAGTDTLDASAVTGNLSINLAFGAGGLGQMTGALGTSSIFNIENITTGSGNDTIFGNTGNNILKGDGGADNVNGNFGNDTLIASADGANDVYNGFNGTDTLDYSETTLGVSINLSTGLATGGGVGTDTINGIENVTGGSGNDTITTTNISGVFQGGLGNDTYSANFKVAPPPNPVTGGTGFMQQTITDAAGNNTLNLRVADISSVRYSISGSSFNLGLTGVDASGNNNGNNITISNWFNGTSYRPITSINLITDTGTQVMTSLAIDNFFKPTARDDSFNAQSKLTVSGNVLSNNGGGADLVGVFFGTLSVTPNTITTAHGGTVAMAANGSFTYTGPAGYSGSDSFDYTITNSASQLSDIGTVLISNIFDQPNRPPVAVNDVLDADGTLQAFGNLLKNDSDPDGQQISIHLQTVTTANGGTATVFGNGDVSYTAAEGFRGSDSFTYTIEDIKGVQTTGTVTVNDIFSNNVPIAQDDSFNLDQQGAASGNLLANDSDPDLDSFAVLEALLVTTNGGQIQISANGDFTYQAASGYTGNDSFEYILQDSFGGRSTATVNIVGFSVNQDPDAKDDLFSAQQAAAVSGNVLVNNGNGADSDPDGDSLSVIAQDFTTANGNIVSLAANGNFSYQAIAGFRGSDSFSYTVTDGQGGSDTATVNISNIFTNRAPVAQDDQINALNGGSVAANLLANHGNGADSDPDGDTLSVFAQTFTTANGGQVTISADGNVNYNAAEGYRGSDNFGYILQDAFGATDTGTVNISNVFTNRAPVTKADSFSGNQGVQIAGNVLVNNGNGADADPDGDTLAVTAQNFTTTHGGIVALAQNGSFTYTPATGYFGADSFTYTLLDAYGATATGTVNLTINQASTNHAPDAKNDDFSVYYGDVISGNLLANNGSGADTDPDNDPLHIVETAIVTAQGINVSIAMNGAFLYSHPADFIGTDSFSYTVSDGHGGTDIATVSLHVNTPSGAIVGTPGIDNMTGTSNADVMIGLAGNDTIGSGGGNDKQFGGSGNDRLIGGSGDDCLYGETGDDQLEGGSDNDCLFGGSGNDRLIGGSDNDTLDGGVGNDTLEGGTGSDILFGGDGNDVFNGGSGNDILISGKGADVLTGGSGVNTYIFTADTAYSGVDTITDFSKSGGDKLDLNDLISFNPLHDVITSFVEITSVNGNSIVKVDADGAGTASGFVQIATLQGVTGLTDEAALVASGNLIVS
ncbi:MAG: Ig-like domain-containing protein [bacterium]|nr:Ig-like domain-containing protein [bacterium]